MGRWPGSSSGAARGGAAGRGAGPGGDAAILAGLGLWALDGHDAQVVMVLTVAATTRALLSMASKDRAAALGLPPAPERPLGWLLGGRDEWLLLVAVGAVLGAPVAALAAITATSALSLGLRVAFLAARRLPTSAIGVSPPGWAVSSRWRLTCDQARVWRSGRWPARSASPTTTAGRRP
jgi:hypothetical protein